MGDPVLSMGCYSQSYYHGAVKTAATILRLLLTGLLTAVFSLPVVAVPLVRFNHMVDIVPHGLGSVNSFLHTYKMRFEGSRDRKSVV